MHGEDAAEIETRVQNHLRPRPPIQAVELSLDQFGTEPQRQHDLLDAGGFEHAQVALEQAHAVEAQQALGQLLILGQLQTQTSTRGEDDGAHEILAKLRHLAILTEHYHSARRAPHGVPARAAAAPARSEKCKYNNPGSPSSISLARFASDRASPTSGASPTRGASSR